jgi:hypothetical protein
MKRRYEIQEKKNKVPVWYAGIYRLISSIVHNTSCYNFNSFKVYDPPFSLNSQMCAQITLKRGTDTNICVKLKTICLWEHWFDDTVPTFLLY